MSIDPKFVIERFGKPFVLFAGLLDLAHERGLLGIKTAVILDASDPKEQFWVVYARGQFKGEDGEVREFTGYGDASPASSQMKGAYLRHAETRAVARMLRMATNVGMTAFEELGGEDEAKAGAAAAPRAVEMAIKHSPVCVDCGAPVPAAIYRASVKHFDAAVCEECGRKRIKAQKEKLYAEQAVRLEAERQTAAKGA
jgi:DNA-directed RNA polymerase subunit RPC12/RpoP